MTKTNITIGLVLLLAGIIAGYFIFGGKNNDRIEKSEEIIKRQKDSIRALHMKIGEFQVRESDLNDSLRQAEEKYDSIKKKQITSKQTDSLQREEIRKGIAKFGRSPVRQAQAALASLFGNQAFDYLDITEKKLENQKRVSATYAGITVHQDTVITQQEMIIRIQKKETIRKNVGWFLGGSVFGFLLSLLLLI